MVSITSRLLPSGRVTWRVQFRVAGRLTERRFPSHEIARDWIYGGGLRELHDVKIKSQRPASVVVHEVEFLLTMGESAETVCRALGMAPPAVQRALYRAGRLDLARRIGAK
jgi:hypothetical protein